ncbi:MAG TPA: hypothetical protein VK698_26810 [Kofleriaceae bacterium]|nr:hypothetical protein [Kofleriaceae bacterium]
MMPLSSMFIASLTGAMLFFAAGFLLARRHLGEAAAVDLVVPPRVPPPVVELPAPTAAADPDPHLATLRAQVNELRNALRDARVREQGHADLEREVLRLRGERAEAEKKARSELAMELEAARRGLAEIGEVRDENAALRDRAAEGDAARARLAELGDEVRDLRARGVATAPPPRLNGTATTSPPRPPGDPRSTAEQLSLLLARLRGKNMRAIALSDEIGLPIVGLGDDPSTLSAFAGYLTDIGRKARDFLPLGPIRRVIVEDENDTTVTTCPQTGETSIALITLTVGPGPSARQMGDLLRSAASLLR